MNSADLIAKVREGWEALAAGEMDRLASFYAEEMVFVLPGQDDILLGRKAYRDALDAIGQALPPGFDIKALRYAAGENEVVNVIEWTSDKLQGGSQSAVVFRFNDAREIVEERWFVDTEQWKAAF